ncbi:FlaG family protein [uncultured Campylobacter sp.]|uniref:FlaG family protein n=1 Tax=uncultured Campylobacter sp. TaxID=218934 RepID=UPI0025E69CA5|nr:FlaG family protein [uncultured Campylobacter sp.]
MEIFKAASQPMANVATSSHAQSSTQTREVEQTHIQHDATRNLTEQNNETLSKEVKEATEKLNKQMEDLGTSIRFGYNDKIGAMYVNVMEMKTGEVIRKIPTEQAMKLSEYFKEAVGVLFDKES